MSVFHLPGRFRFPGRRWNAAIAILSVAVVNSGFAILNAADEAPPADTTPLESAPAQAAATGSATPAFQPEDISIGEPISLPFAAPLASPAPGRAPLPPANRPTGPQRGPQPTSGTQLPSVMAPASPAAAEPAPASPVPNETRTAQGSAAAGNGWLGIAVDDALVTGRLVVVEVAPDGPAAKAGVRPQDMLLAIDGNHLQNGDELAAAFAAITPGQTVRMAIGRENRIEDIVAQAAARPPEALSRDWQSAANGGAENARAGAAGGSVPAFATAPPLEARTQLAREPDGFGVLPSPRTPVASPLASAPPLASSFPAAAIPERADPVASQPTRAVASAPALATASAVTQAASGRTALGVRTVPVDPNTQSRFRLPEPQGAFVIGVVQDLPASRAGVPPGSVIVAINHQPVRSPRDLTQLVASGPVGTPVPLHYVLPGGQSKQAEVVLQSLQQPLERALVGDGDAAPMHEPPALQPAPQMLRRVEPVAGSEPAGAPVLEDLLRRINNRLQQIERRLERLEPAR